MLMRAFAVLTFLSLVLAAEHLFANDNVPAVWVNTKVDRVLDVSKAYVKEIITIDAKNVHSTPAGQYVYPVPKVYENDYALILATNAKAQGQMLSVKMHNNSVTNPESDYNFLIVSFPAPVAPKADVQIQFQFIVLHNLLPSTDKLGLNDQQKLLLKLFKYIVSPYPTEEYTVSLFGADDADTEDLHESKSNPDLPKLERTVANNLVVYTASEPIAPYTVDYLSFLFSRNKPLPVGEKLERSVWLSHWGSSISFEETLQLTNKVSKLDKGFSRLEWMRTQPAQQLGAQIIGLEMELPPRFREAFYVDLVGNVSTSKIVGNRLILKPRYPIFGGWNYNFTIGWVHDLKQFVRLSVEERGVYYLKFPLLNGHLDISYNNVDINVYLPEGAEFLDVASPMPYDSIDVDLEKSFLDYAGHTKVTLHYKNLVDEFRQSYLIVKYQYTAGSFYKKPLVIGGFLFAGLISYLLLTKIDITIDSLSKQEEVEEVQEEEEEVKIEEKEEKKEEKKKGKKH